MAANRGKAVYERESQPCKEGKTLARRLESGGGGSKFFCRQRIVSLKFSVIVAMHDHLVVENMTTTNLPGRRGWGWCIAYLLFTTQPMVLILGIPKNSSLDVPEIY